MPDVLKFCGEYVPYPIAMNGRQAARVDNAVSEQFNEIVNVLQAPGVPLQGSIEGCATSLERELCLASFPMCENAADIVYCARALVNNTQNQCDSAFACAASELYVVCAQRTADFVCVQAAASLCGGITPPPIGATCETLSEQVCISGLPPPLGRCFNRRVRNAPAGAPVANEEVFVASGGSDGPVVLWAAALALDSEPPLPTLPTEFGTDGYNGAALRFRLTGPIAAVGLAILAIALIVVRLRRSSGRQGGAAYFEVGDADGDDEDDEDEPSGEYDGVRSEEPGSVDGQDAARIAVAARLKNAVN